MAESGETAVQVTCPCCGSTLFIDAGAGVVKEWKEAKDPRKSADLKDAEKLLADEKARVEARYGARAVRAEEDREGERRVYRIRLLSPDGRVFEVVVDADSGEEE